MAKIRVYELAKQLSVSSKDLIEVLRELGATDVKSHQSGIDEAVASKAAAVMIKRSIHPAKPSRSELPKTDKTAKPTPKIEVKKPIPKTEVKPKNEAVLVGNVQPETSKLPSPRQTVITAKTKREDAKAAEVLDAVKESTTQKVTLKEKESKPASKEPEVKHLKHTNEPVHKGHRDGAAPHFEAKRASQEEQPKVAKPAAKVQKKEPQKFVKHEQNQQEGQKHFHAKNPPQQSKFEAHSQVQQPQHQKQQQAQSKPPVKSYHSRIQGTHQGRITGHAPISSKPAPQKVVQEEKERAIEIALPITIAELAKILSLKPADVLKKLLENGRMLPINHTLDQDSIYFILDIMEIPHSKITFKEDIPVVEEEEEDPRFLMPRPPVVTILGHVDHGKTSLLDAIRKSNVTASESGGITQKIGAYVVEQMGKKVVFIDTPGHEAFTAMRARGAEVTDVAVLVVAADDGVMPQTLEAISHAKAAHVPVVVALNKIDKPNASPDRVKQQLSENGLLVEDWGGDVVCVPVSAKTKVGIEDLLEMILLVADMNDLKANPRRPAQGVIIESKLDKGLGPVATVLVQKGTLRVGDALVAGMVSGKIRLLINDKGERVKKAGPSIPVEIVGLTELPNAGDIMRVVKDDKVARQITTDRRARSRERNLVSGPRTTLQDIFKNLKEGEKKNLNLIIKADGNGSVEAIKHSLSKLTDDEVNVEIIHGAVGSVTESDIHLAKASDAIIIAFNLKEETSLKKLAEQEQIDIRHYDVIYHMIEDIEAAMKGLLEPEYEQVLVGKVEVRQIFKISKLGTIVGCYVQSGKVVRNGEVKVYRGKKMIFEGKLESLKRFKDDVKEVAEGFECGISVEKFDDFVVGDLIEIYQQQQKPR